MTTELLQQEAPAQRPSRWRASIEEFWQLPESNLPTEYVNGEIIMPPSPTVPHQSSLGNMYFVIRHFVRQAGIGECYFSPLDVVLPTGDVVQPDIFFLNNAQAAQVKTEKRVRGIVPAFVVEILSPGSVTHDAITKRALYERNGVREYWIVDTKRRTIAQLVLDQKHYALTELTAGDQITGVVLEGFTINVGELLGV
ncbi:MAG: Uma2 family endonuclease [Pyrinomonadaceae bacterium]|nr:Uma2 family endonuclease [Pyrinomonadaceae bacterium]